MFCGSCGARSGSPEQRFCATCGQPLATLEPTQPTQPTAPVAPPVQPWAAPPASGGGRRAGRTTILVVVGVVVALVAGSVTAWSLFRPRGGSDSPEEAVRAFVSAATKQDVVALLDTVNPAEVKGFVTAYDAARERATGEDLVGDGDIAAAFSVELSDLQLETHQEADDIAQVTLEGGRYDVTYDPSEVPGRLSAIAAEHPDALSWTGDVMVRDNNDELVASAIWPLWWLPQDPFVDDSNYEQVARDLRPAVDVVRVDGRWYVSLVRAATGYVAYGFGGNYVPGAGELDWAAADGESEPVVGETPEELVANLVDAINSLDPDDLLDSFPADEVIALRPVAEAVGRRARDELGRVDVSVDDLDLSTEDRGDTVVVTLEGARAAGSSDGGSGEVEYSNGCFYGTFGDECLAEEPGFEPVRDPFVVMEKVDGGYQLSWSATAAEYVVLYADSMPDRLVDELVDEIESAASVYSD